MIPEINNKEIAAIAHRMNLPANLLSATRSKIPESMVAVIDKYTENFEHYMKRGVGFVLSGKQGVGKSSISAYLAKHARMHLKGDEKKFCSVYFIRSYDYREKFRNKEMFDDEHSIYEWCRKVDFLVMDNLMAEDANPVWPTSRIFTELIAPRCTEGKATIITTTLTKREMKHYFTELCNSIAGYLLFADVVGPDQRIENAKKLNEEFFGVQDEK